MPGAHCVIGAPPYLSAWRLATILLMRRSIGRKSHSNLLEGVLGHLASTSAALQFTTPQQLICSGLPMPLSFALVAPQQLLVSDFVAPALLYQVRQRPPHVDKLTLQVSLSMVILSYMTTIADWYQGYARAAHHACLIETCPSLRYGASRWKRIHRHCSGHRVSV